MTLKSSHFDPSRSDRVRALLRREGLDALLVSSPSNVSYLTGFSGDSSYLLLARDKVILLSDGRFTEQIRQECPGLETVIRKTTGVRMPGIIARTAGQLGVTRLGVEATVMSVLELTEIQTAMSRLQLKPVSGLVESHRICKDSREIRHIRRAISIAEQAFTQFRSEFARFESEKAAADRLETLMRAAGAERGSFETIIAVGPHAAQGHARPDSRPIKANQPIVVDWGASGRFYKSDLTRTLCVRRIPAKLEAVYKVVLKAR